MTTRGFFVAMPANSQHRHLHAPGCRQTRVRTRRELARRDLLNIYHVERGEWQPSALDASCVCMTGRLPEARADAWLNMLQADREYLVNQRASALAYTERTEKVAAWRAQFEGLRAGAEALWGEPVVWDQYTYNGNLALRLGDPQWRDVGSVYLTATDGTVNVEIDSLNLSSSATRTPERVHRLSRVLHYIEMWRASEPLVVPPEAPDFVR